MTVPTLRQGTIADAEALAVILRTSKLNAMPWLPDLHTAEEDQDFVRDRVLGGTDVVVATDALGHAVGFVSYSDSWVHHLYVAPASQGLGIGTALLEHVRLHHPRGVRLWVFARNTEARRFYDRFGAVALDETDGSGNEEKEPDVLLAIPPHTP